MEHASELLFGGRIPAVFYIVESEITSTKVPSPYHALLSRMSYLPLETIEVVNHFKGSVIELEQSVWFEYDGKPLKSNLPVGVLFDLHNPDPTVPWKIHIHFRQYPSNKVVRSSSREDVERLYTHALKQSVFLLSGSTRLFTSLSIQRQSSLHDSVMSGDFLVYKDVISEICFTVNKSSARSVPVVIIVNDERPLIHRPVNVYTKNEICHDILTDEKSHTIEENINSQQNETIEKKVGNDLIEVDSISIATGSNARLTTLQDVLSDVFQEGDAFREIIIQGIKPPMDAPIYEIWERLCHVDLFLYIIVHLNNKCCDPTGDVTS